MSDTGTLIIAVVGVALGAASLTWQIYSWVIGNATRVRVEAGMGQIYTDDQVQDVVFVRALNRSSHDVNVEEVSLRRPGSQARFILVPDPCGGSQLPGTVPARSKATAHFGLADFEAIGFDFSQPVRASVRLATGKIVSSKKQVLGDFDSVVT